MEEALLKLIGLIPENLSLAMPAEVESSVKFSMQRAENVVRMDVSEVNYRQAMFSIQSVLDITWEQLNTGHWSKVPLHLRFVYTASSFIKILAILRLQKSTKSTSSNCETLKSALKTADMGLLLGAPLPLTLGCCLTKAASILSDVLAEQDINTSDAEIENRRETVDEKQEYKLNNRVIGLEISRVQRPSLERFRSEHFDRQLPVILTDCIGHWPALTRWRDSAYLRRIAGARTVPVELGSEYTDQSWSQKLMTLTDFIDTHVKKTKGPEAEIGYLAQHPLFDQVPELLSDIREPEYCCISEQQEAAEESTAINAWFGPAGTVSPLHFDPKHNLLAQVVGSKHVYLYSPDDTTLLYPHEGKLLFNTAQVDPESPDYMKYPQYRDACAWQCQLNSGEMLYIPPKWWHHVRSLETSFSVSFWWT